MYSGQMTAAPPTPRPRTNRPAIIWPIEKLVAMMIAPAVKLTSAQAPRTYPTNRTYKRSAIRRHRLLPQASAKYPSTAAATMEPTVHMAVMISCSW